MFTRDELRVVPLFSDLTDDELDYLAKTSADLRLRAGEYVIYEGETRRALFFLISGRLDILKTLNGAERVVGVRAPGESFGELPFVLNVPNAVSVRATQDSRVLRIEPKDFQAVAAAAPEFSSAIGSLAMERVGGLQDLAAEPPQRLAVIGEQWDGATHLLRDFLQRNAFDYDSIVPESSGRYPVVRLPDGTLLHQPSLRELARAIGLCVSPAREEYDVAIVGGGPAGLAAAVYGSSEGLSTVLVEREAPGGQAGTSSRIENYLGFPFGISGDDLAHRALEQARRLGADIVVTRTVQGIETPSRSLLLDGEEKLRTKAIVLANGVSWRHLDIDGLDRLLGQGVYYGAAPGEIKAMHGNAVYIVGGGNSAGQAAVSFSNFASCVTLLVRGESLAKSMSHYLIEQLKTKPNVRVETHSHVVEVYGKERLEAIGVRNSASGATSRRETPALFIMIGADAETQWLPEEIEKDERGYIVTGRGAYLLETTVPGIFAAGDVRAGSIKRVAAAVGEGSMVIALIHQYLASP